MTSLFKHNSMYHKETKCWIINGQKLICLNVVVQDLPKVYTELLIFCMLLIIWITILSEHRFVLRLSYLYYDFKIRQDIRQDIVYVIMLFHISCKSIN